MPDAGRVADAFLAARRGTHGLGHRIRGRSAERVGAPGIGLPNPGTRRDGGSGRVLRRPRGDGLPPHDGRVRVRRGRRGRAGGSHRRGLAPGGERGDAGVGRVGEATGEVDHAEFRRKSGPRSIVGGRQHRSDLFRRLGVFGFVSGDRRRWKSRESNFGSRMMR